MFPGMALVTVQHHVIVTTKIIIIISHILHLAVFKYHRSGVGGLLVFLSVPPPPLEMPYSFSHPACLL